MSTDVGALGGTPIPRPTAPARGVAARGVAATHRAPTDAVTEAVADSVTRERLARLRAPDPTRSARVDGDRERLEQGLLGTMSA